MTVLVIFRNWYYSFCILKVFKKIIFFIFFIFSKEFKFLVGKQSSSYSIGVLPFICDPYTKKIFFIVNFQGKVGCLHPLVSFIFIGRAEMNFSTILHHMTINLCYWSNKENGSNIVLVLAKR
jgi:hypothetical protein